MFRKLCWSMTLVLWFSVPMAWSADPWMELHAYYGPSGDPVVISEDGSLRERVRSSASITSERWNDSLEWSGGYVETDRWSSGRPLENRRPSLGNLHQRLAPFRELIDEASARFNVPPEVIGAVIMVESSGDPRARAKTSSAKGLMQTIDATFDEARAGLRERGLYIPDDPYQPNASIMAGSWYLDSMFRRMEADYGRRFDRGDLSAWRKVAEYYYAGPVHGRKRDGVVVIYAGGRRVVVDKEAYGRRVMSLAKLMG